MLYGTHKFENDFIFPDLKELSRLSQKQDFDYFEGVSFKTATDLAHVNVKIVGTSAGFKNILGAYTVDHEGTMNAVRILALDTRSLSKGHEYNLDVSTNQDLQFFLIANGYSHNKNLDFSDGDINFVFGLGTDDERLANISDDPAFIFLVHETNNSQTAIDGAIYHSGNSGLSQDAKHHVIFGLTFEGGDSLLRVGFEDFPNLGDADFNDLVFDLRISYETSSSLISNNIEMILGDEKGFSHVDDDRVTHLLITVAEVSDDDTISLTQSVIENLFIAITDMSLQKTESNVGIDDVESLEFVQQLSHLDELVLDFIEHSTLNISPNIDSSNAIQSDYQLSYGSTHNNLDEHFSIITEA